jgi:Fe2+ transport system protein FeoA
MRHGSSAMPLSMVSPGETVELVQIRECRRLRKRLADLGLNVGLDVRVVQNCFSGPLILAVKEDARLAIGRGMARQILVVPRKK